MRSTDIPNPLFSDKDKKTLEASFQEEPPISPFSGRRMLTSNVNGIPVFVDDQSRIVVPAKRH